MERLSLISSAVILFITSNSFITNTDQKIEVVFTAELRYSDLVQIKKDLAANGITIEYSKLEFGRDKKLKSIEFFVNCNDGYSGKANSNHLSANRRFGFYRDFDEDANVHFYAGFLK